MNRYQSVVNSSPSRRRVLAGMAGAVACAGLNTGPAESEEEASAQFKAAYAKLVGDRKTREEGVKLTLPDIAENGNMVPFSVYVESPMTEEDFVKSVTIFSTGNPQPVIGTFHFLPVSGRALVGGRLRLARSQDLVIVAETNAGALVTGRANVTVTIGGCGAG